MISSRPQKISQPGGSAGSYSKENSQISLCMGNQRASRAQSRLPWQCSGQRGSHTRSWHQPCLRFVARCQWLRLPGCCSNRKRCETGGKASCSQAPSPRNEGNSPWSHGSSGRTAPVPSPSEYLPQLLLFSAPVPFTLKRKVTSIFDSLPLPYEASEYM